MGFQKSQSKEEIYQIKGSTQHFQHEIGLITQTLQEEVTS